MPDVIIIGAGVIGTSIGFHLTKLGCRDVVILEKNYIGSGSTEKCPGGIRQQFSAEVNIRLSIESVRFFEQFEEETGHPADFRQHGYVILATTEGKLDTLRENINLQRKLGLKVDLISPQDIAELIPGVNVRDVLGGTFCPSDGYADPYSVVSGFASAARRLGARIFENTEVTSIELSGDRVKGVLTTASRFEAPVVVNAAGPYAGIIGKMAGLDIPIRPSRRHIFITEPVFKRSDQPMVIDFHNGFWFRREGPCLIFGMRNNNEPEGFSTSVDWDFFAEVAAPAACHRLPCLTDTGIMRAQAGLHSDTPDYMAILGEVSTAKGLYLTCGFSGHGFMHSPAVGKLMAELIIGKTAYQPYTDLLSLDRFDRQIEQRETAFV